MSPHEFTLWRNLLSINKTEAARLLGLAPNTVTAYEKGRVPIPRYVALACTAVSSRLEPWSEKILEHDISS